MRFWVRYISADPDGEDALLLNIRVDCVFGVPHDLGCFKLYLNKIRSYPSACIEFIKQNENGNTPNGVFFVGIDYGSRTPSAAYLLQEVASFYCNIDLNYCKNEANMI